MKKRKRNVRNLPLDVEPCGCTESDHLRRKLWRAEWRLRDWARLAMYAESLPRWFRNR